ncbi:MAG: SDR family NAD(P)-dependent oxidoreductase, partial [Halieaceae bacterium]
MAKNYALITGASAGLGAEFARQLADRGHNLVLVARREDRLRELADDLATQHKVEVEIIAADLSEPSAPGVIATQCRERGLDIDWLINNAGVAGPDLLLDRKWSEQASFFQLMMTSVAALCHLMLPAMLERGYGRVINVASVAGRIPRSGGCNYGPSKA